jgi:hypothetical protein
MTSISHDCRESGPGSEKKPPKYEAFSVSILHVIFVSPLSIYLNIEFLK